MNFSTNDLCSGSRGRVLWEVRLTWTMKEYVLDRGNMVCKGAEAGKEMCGEYQEGEWEECWKGTVEPG